MGSTTDDQQFCLRWNNFQSNITTQFEALRDDEDFTDVTIACDGQQVQAHKIILSACSPFFKELLKSNPCSHPIIFMRDVEAQHIVALMEFMYAGEVNIAQTQLTMFLKTAEALKIRGLTHTSSSLNKQNEGTSGVDGTLPSSSSFKERLNSEIWSSSSIVTSSQDVDRLITNTPSVKRCKTETATNHSLLSDTSDVQIELKHEVADYFSDEDCLEDGSSNFNSIGDVSELVGGMEIIPQSPCVNNQETAMDTFQGTDRNLRRSSFEDFIPFGIQNDHHEEDTIPDLPNLLRKCRNKSDKHNKKRLVKLGEGIEIDEEQLLSVKWSDYRKLTRGLATILFKPEELATCSVTGQRWSRAGNVERPVKPALDRSKVQAIISYVANRFPLVEVSRIKQVLAYKCKENSTAFKMKAVRYYGELPRVPDN